MRDEWWTIVAASLGFAALMAVALWGLVMCCWVVLP
jgi:hypothetical protein